MRQKLLDIKMMFFGNPNTVRDYRTQMRGNRAPILWTIYLFFLIGIAALMYMNVSRNSVMSIVEMQRGLKGFYGQVMILLEVMLFLVAPVLTGTSIVGEYQRRSIELIETAPMTPAQFIVGKLISSWRLVWMLLILSLPVTSVCIVMGGATWKEVLETYLLMSLHGLLYAALALPIAVLAKKVVSTVFMSYVALGVAHIAFLLLIPSVMMSSFSGSKEMPVLASLIGGTSQIMAGKITMIGSIQIPVYLASIPIHLILVALLVAGASSAMTRFGSGETRTLRIVGLIAAAAVSAAMSWSLAPAVSMMTGMTAGGSGSPFASDTSYILFAGMCMLGLGLLPCIPSLACYSLYEDKKHAPSPLFDFKNIFNATPGSAIPYGLALAIMSYLGSSVVLMFYKGDFPLFDHRCVWFILIYMYFVSLGRMVSSWIKAGVEASIKGHFAAIVFSILMPLPVLVMSGVARSGSFDPLWIAYPFSAPFLQEMWQQIVCLAITCVLIIVALVIENSSLKGLKAKVSYVEPAR